MKRNRVLGILGVFALFGIPVWVGLTAASRFGTGWGIGVGFVTFFAFNGIVCAIAILTAQIVPSDWEI